MGIGTFGAFTQARLAIYAAQTGLSVTGNNISNINTPGYTRQRLNQVSLYTAGSDRYYAEGDVRTGQGALVKNISQIRSPYLDIRFREYNAQVGYMDAKLGGLDSIAMILDEVGKGDESKDEDGFGVLGLYINKLASALKDLTIETGHQEFDDTVRSVAGNLVTQLHSYASKLEDLTAETIHDFNQDLEKVNNILTNIRSLNEEIRKSEIHGDPALELRDERNNQIDELSGLIDIDVSYSEEEITGGLTVEKLTIRLGNANPDGKVETDESLLVDGIYAAQLMLKSPKMNPDYNPDMEATDPNYDSASTPFAYLKAGGGVTNDIREAELLTGDENENYSLMISSLKNKVGELHRSTQKGALTKVDGNDEVTIKNDDGTTSLVKISDLLAKVNTTSVSADDTPGRGDTTITIYNKRTDKDGNVYYTKQEFQKIVSKPVALDDNDLGGELQAERELLTEAGVFADQKTIASVDENAASKRGIPYYQRTLDLLANQLATVMNEANQGFRVDQEGNYITKKTNDEGKEIGVPIEITAGGVTHKLNKNDTWDKLPQAIWDEIKTATGLTTEVEDGEVSGKDAIDAYLKGQKYDATAGKFDPEDMESWKTNGRGIFDGAVLFSNANNSDDATNITAANINISKSWTNGSVLVRSFICVAQGTEPASGASDNISHLEYLVDKQKWDFTPETVAGNSSSTPMFNGTLFEMWNDIGSVLGQDRSVTGTMLDTAYQNALSVDTERDSVSSVDFNDEAMNLMMYAKSYNAACRLMTTLDSVLDKLINNTGLTT